MLLGEVSRKVPFQFMGVVRIVAIAVWRRREGLV